MITSYLKTQFKKSLFFLSVITFFVLNDALADNNQVRDSFVDNNSGRCETKKLEFAPFQSAGGDLSSDINWEMFNPTCIAFMEVAGIPLNLAIASAGLVCSPESTAQQLAVGLTVSNVASSLIPSPLSIISLIRYSFKAIALGVSGSPQALPCAGSILAGYVALGVAVAELAIIHQTAVDTQQNAHICGEKWNTLQKADASTQVNGYKQGYFKDDKVLVRKNVGNNTSYQEKLQEEFGAGGKGTRDISNPHYREYLYGGVEYEDNGTAFAKSKEEWLKSEVATSAAIKAQNDYTNCQRDNNCIDDDVANITNNRCRDKNPPACKDEYAARNVKQKESYAALEEAKKKTYEDTLNTGGVDFVTEATLSEGCNLPNIEQDKLLNIFGYSGGKQRYYMRGPGLAPNYACERFLINDTKYSDLDKQKIRAAYECCKKRGQETICIEENRALNSAFGRADAGGYFIDDYNENNHSQVDHKFCKIGERCKIMNVWYDIYESKDDPSYICAKTYSVCPYNHNLGGGTTIATYDSKYPNILTNSCQYLKHCVKKYTVPTIALSTLDDGGGFISSTCRNLKGDAQNNYGFNADLLPVNATKNFSAPIAQCFKETFENMFVNIAGFTKCRDSAEQPDQYDICKSGYTYKKGAIITSKPSFFQTIQNYLRTAIKMAMTIAISIMGIGVLLSGKIIEKKALMMFIVKLTLVAYFALGTAWQDYFFSGVSGTSMALADIFMRIDEGTEDNQKDGCQFPKYNAQFIEGSAGTKYDNPSYPRGKEYLAIWDTFDCKIARALGFGEEVSVPNLFYMIVAGFFTGGLGIIFFISTFIFAFFLIAITIRALHIFLISSIAITLMIYVSPITITACLFKRTEGIFKNWKSNLMGFVLQPVVLFAFLGVLITLFDKVLIGDATFSGDGRNTPKQIVCSSNSNGDNSIYCIFNFAKIQTNPILEPIGIAIPILDGMNLAKLETIFKGAFLMFIFANLLNVIMGLVAKLTGGAALGSQSMGVTGMTAAAYGIASGIQQRGRGVMGKLGGGAMSLAGDAMQSLGNKGKEVDDSGGGKPGGNPGVNTGGNTGGNTDIKL